MRRTAALATALALALLGPAGCSSGGDDDAAGGGGEAVERAAGSIRGMLDLVPDTGETRQYVSVALYREGAERAGVRLADGAGRDEEMDRLADLSLDPDVATGFQRSELAGGNAMADRYGALGYVPSDIAAEVQAGVPPRMVLIGVGAFDDEVLAAAEEVEGASRTEVDGTDVVSWLEDGAVERGLEAPLGSVPGQAGRVAVPADGLIVHTTADAPMAAAVATVDGDEPSLADHEPLAAAARALDDAEAHAAFLSVEPVPSVPAGRSSGLSDGPAALVPYLAYGVGAVRGDDGAELVIVLVHGSDDVARENAERLEARFEDGLDDRTRRPWTDVLDDPTVERDGAVVVARAGVDQAQLWSQLVQSRSTLLAAG